MMFKKFSKYMVFLLLLGVLVFLYSFSSNRNSNKTVDNIVVEFEVGDNHFLTHDMVNNLLIQNEVSVKNKRKSAINLYELENTVVKNPYVEKASVFLTVGGVLKSIVKQRTPLARIMARDASYYIDKDGEVIPLSEKYSARVLLISGVEDEKKVKEILSLVKFILNDDFLKKEIIGIEKLDEDNYQFSVRSGDYKIDFGKIASLDLKFKKLKAFYNKAFVDKTIKNYKKINLKYHNQVVCTK